MTLIDKIQINRIVKTRKTESEVTFSLKGFDCKKIEIENQVIKISGETFYDFVCNLNLPEVKLTARLKNVPLICILAFLIIWTSGFIYENGILFGLLVALFFTLFFGFIHKKLMQSSLDELTKLINE